jgi:hypothetical protein
MAAKTFGYKSYRFKQLPGDASGLETSARRQPFKLRIYNCSLIELLIE